MNTVARPGPSSHPARLTPVATAGDETVLYVSDDAFLSDLEVALEHQRTHELLPFDALTPHVREVGDMLR